MTTVLDLRFKKIPFLDASAVDQTTRKLIKHLHVPTQKDASPNSPSSIEKLSKRESTCSLWDAFEQKVSKLLSHRNLETDAK